MKQIITSLVLLLLGAGLEQVCAQTNQPLQQKLTSQIEVSSDQGFFDGIKRQMVYKGNVLVVYGKSTLKCGQLTVDLPPEGGEPTNIVALTNVVIDALDESGRTNHITANKAVYSYTVENSVTNKMLNFYGGDPMPKFESPQFIAMGEPLTYNLITRQITGSNYQTIIKNAPGLNGTNASPLNLLK